MEPEQFLVEPRDESSAFVFICYCLKGGELFRCWFSFQAIDWKPNVEFFEKSEAKRELIRSESGQNISAKSVKSSASPPSSPRSLQRSSTATPNDNYAKLMSNKSKSKKKTETEAKTGTHAEVVNKLDMKTVETKAPRSPAKVLFCSLSFDFLISPHDSSHLIFLGPPCADCPRYSTT